MHVCFWCLPQIPSDSAICEVECATQGKPCHWHLQNNYATQLAEAKNRSVTSSDCCHLNDDISELETIFAAGAGLAFAVLQKMATTHVFKPAGDPAWPRTASLTYMVTMVQV